MMYETTSKETEMMHGRTTKRSCMGVPTIVHFYKAVSQSCLLVSSVQLAHSKQELCRSRAKLCRDISEGDTHLCKRTSETGYLPLLPFRIKCDRVSKKTTTCGQRASRATGNDHMCPREGGKIHERYSTSSNKAGPH